MTARRVPNDPGRRDRIVEAACELMVRDGLHTLTHRRIAAHAGVPLGSTTYYFADLDELLLAAVRRAVADGRERLRRWSDALGPDADADRVCTALAEMSVEHVTTAAARTVLDYELYVAGLRRESLRAESEAWIGLLRAALAEHLDAATADALTAAADGVVLQALLSRYPPTVERVEALFRRVVKGPGLMTG